MHRLLVLAATIMIAGCVLFVGDSEFYLMNDTTYPLTVRWVERRDDVVRSIPEPIGVGETATITYGRMLNAPELTPSLFFSRITVDAFVAGKWSVAYDRHPVNDDDWTVTDDEESLGSGNYLLVLSDDELALQ